MDGGNVQMTAETKILWLERRKDERSEVNPSPAKQKPSRNCRYNSKESTNQ
jgi:hypothetical protein